jgi:Major tropism determinant N-terminal domain/Pectate lyase superfamily protein
MAVVQISRIQIRRGQANQGTGLPQLASAEMAWAIDTQELYIGNGAVSEGAPAVGNTKILTQNDLSAAGNLLGLLQYVYKTNDTTIITGPDVNHVVSRSLQARLDDRVSLTDFLTTADISSGDYTAALQRAINQLFLNSNNKASNDPAGVPKRLKLEIPAGIYPISEPIYIPSYTTIVGAGVDKTVINYNPTFTILGSTVNNSTTVTTTGATSLMVGASITGTNIPTGATVTAATPGVSLTISSAATGSTSSAESITVVLSAPAIQFVNDSSTPGNPSFINSTLGITQPKHISIDGITVNLLTASTGLQLDAVRDSMFENIKIVGSSTTTASSIGLLLNVAQGYQTTDGVSTSNNTFRNIYVSNLYYGVYSLQDIRNNVFDTCHFYNLNVGASLSVGADIQLYYPNGTISHNGTIGQLYGARETVFTNCKFELINQQGVYIGAGYGNSVDNCRFVNVGNNGSFPNAVYPQVYFASTGNKASRLYSDRSTSLSLANDPTNASIAYVPELAGHGVYESYATQTLPIANTTQFTLAFRLPVSTDNYGSPTGTITHLIDYIYTSSYGSFSRTGTITIVANIAQANIQISDEFNFAGSDPTNVTCLLLDFKAIFLSQTGSVYTGAGGQVPSTVEVSYVNNYTNDYGTFVYSYKSIL